MRAKQGGSMKLIKFQQEASVYPTYGIVEGDSVLPIENRHTVSELFTTIREERFTTAAGIVVDEIKPLPPTDENVHLFCAGLNYRDHAEEVRLPIPESPIFFTKAPGALCGSHDDIVYPVSVSLLDYEIELSVIIGKRISHNDTITGMNLPEYVLGITIMNDISARDIQLLSGQWFLGKTYRTFAPLGPFVQVLDDEICERLSNLTLELQVFGPDGTPYEKKRQRGTTKNMVFALPELINCLTEKFDLRPGDVIATGTPGGVALTQPSRLKMRLAEILGIPQRKRIELFLEGERKNNNNYLIRGDTISARIFSDDGIVDLGEQRNRVR